MPVALLQGGGYLAAQRSIEHAAGSLAAADPDIPGEEGPEAEEDANADPADARQQGAAAAGAAGAASEHRLSLACHIAYHPSYQVPALYFEVCPGLGSSPQQSPW